MDSNDINNEVILNATALNLMAEHWMSIGQLDFDRQKYVEDYFSSPKCNFVSIKVMTVD